MEPLTPGMPPGLSAVKGGCSSARHGRRAGSESCMDLLKSGVLHACGTELLGTGAESIEGRKTENCSDGFAKASVNRFCPARRFTTWRKQWRQPGGLVTRYSAWPLPWAEQEALLKTKRNCGNDRACSLHVACGPGSHEKARG